jgi:hypothetical protein
MQSVVVKAKGNNKNLEGHSTLPWSKQSKFFMELFLGENNQNYKKKQTSDQANYLIFIG